MTEANDGATAGSVQGRDRVRHRTRARFQQLMNASNTEGNASYPLMKDVEETPLLADDYSKMYPASQSSSEDNNSGQSNPAYANETGSEASFKEATSTEGKGKKSDKDISSSKIVSSNRKQSLKERRKKVAVNENISSVPTSENADFDSSNKKEETVAKEEVEKETDEGPILGVVIHGTDRLKTDFLIHHPVVKVHVMDLKTGSYVKKLHRDRSVTSYYETLNETVDYILPIMTQPYDFEAKRYLIPMWEELLMFNEDYSYFLEDDAQIIIFFEIMDFIGSELSGSTNWFKRIQDEGGWHKVAWAFLKLKGANNILNVEKKLRLQLYNPGKTRFWRKTEGIEVYNWWHKRAWSYYPSTLYVTVKSILMPKSVEAANRSMAPFQEEKSLGLLLASPGERNGLHQDDAQPSPKKLTEQTDLWSRVAGQMCKIPNSLLFASQCSAYGCNVVKFSHNGRILAYGCSLDNGHHIVIHKVPSGTFIHQVKAHAGIIYDLDWSKNDDFLTSASGDGTVRVWSTVNMEFSMVLTLPHPCFVYAAKFHPRTPSFLVTGSYDKVVRVWNLENTEKGILCMELEGHRGNINALCFTKKGSKLFSADSMGIIKVWNVDLSSNSQGMMKQWSLDQQIEKKETQGIPINSLCMHTGDKKLLFNSRSSSLFLYDLTVNLAVQHFQGCVNFQHLLRCCFSPCGSLVFAGGEDGKVIVWNANTGDKLAVYSELPYLGPVTCVDYHPYDHIIAVCSLEDNAPVLVYKYDHNEPHIGLEKSGVCLNMTEQPLSPSKQETKTGDSSRSESPVSDTNHKEIKTDSRIVDVQKLETEKTARLQQVMKQLDSVLHVLPSMKKHRATLPSLDETENTGSSNSLGKWRTTDEASLVTSATKSPQKKRLYPKHDDNIYISHAKLIRNHEAAQSAEVIALYNYESGFPDELPLMRGSIIEVLKRDDSEWWFGRIKGTQIEGYFPYNYVAAATRENYKEIMGKDEDEKLNARRSMTALITKSGNFEIVSGPEDDPAIGTSQREETPTNVSSQKRQKRRLQKKQVEYS